MPDKLLANVRVLVCEDEPFLARVICARLVGDGATIIGPFALVSDAASRIGQHGTEIDVAVLDWNLVDGNTQQIAEALSALSIPFLFCTSDESQVRGWPEDLILSKSHLEWVVPRLATLLGS